MAENLSKLNPTTQGEQNPTELLKVLESYDTTLLLHESGSMSKENQREQAYEALGKFAQTMMKYDKDGTGLYLLRVTPTQTADLRQGLLAGGNLGLQIAKMLPTPLTCSAPVPTYTGSIDSCLTKVMNTYLATLGTPIPTKMLSIIVITDGEPTGDASPDLEELFIDTAKKLDDLKAPKGQLVVQFVQIGEDPGASRRLGKLNRLKDKCGGRDMVYCLGRKANGSRRGSTWIKAAVGAVNEMPGLKKCMKKT
ncbi:hypothetical protein F5Y15DRAFT_178710 [Xylariaceae sp. FL0016]|nr:hypothetical protein F5Y15DRAFT_178710 [Xylariaceae sp. FL0016]